MVRLPGGTPRRRAETVAELQSRALERAQSLLRNAYVWLGLLENYHNIDNAPRRPLPMTGCLQPGHGKGIALRPLSGRPTHLMCVAERDKIPDHLIAWIVEQLRAYHFTVSEPTVHQCGCVTFAVQPRQLAGE